MGIKRAVDHRAVSSPSLQAELASLRRRLRRQRLLTAGVVAGLLAIGAVTVARATIPDAGNLFHGCYAKSNGALRLIDLARAQKCSSTEVAVTWNQKGQKGDPGAPGTGGFVALANADLSAADLRYRNLGGQDMRNANLTNANLKGSNLRNANMTGATMSGAILAGATWGNTTCPDGTNSDKDGGTCEHNLSIHRTITVHVGPNGTLTFSPADVTIHVGDTVRWVWDGDFHTVTSGSNGTADGKFCSPSDATTTCGTEPSSNAGTVYSHTFTTAGTFNYFCRIHAGLGMTAKITVQA